MSAGECRGNVLTRILEQHGKEEKAVKAWVVGCKPGRGRREGRSGALLPLPRGAEVEVCRGDCCGRRRKDGRKGEDRAAREKEKRKRNEEGRWGLKQAGPAHERKEREEKRKGLVGWVKKKEEKKERKKERKKGGKRENEKRK